MTVATGPPLVSLPESWVGPSILGSCVLGGLFTLYTALRLSKIEVDCSGSAAEGTPLKADVKKTKRVAEIQQYISDGATAFLLAEYRYMAVFCVLMSFTIYFLIGPTAEGWDSAAFSVIAFLLGAITSVAAGWLGMRIAVYSNGRVTVTAARSYADGFVTAFRGGAVMGFGLTVMGLASLYLGIVAFKIYFKDDSPKLFGTIAAYGLGGSSIALFGRVGGGIFTKAADVGADLVGKIDNDIPEDDPRNPGVIADCIGDNVGDIAGMGSDLFGSFAEATCAALVIASSNKTLSGNWASMMYPLLLSAGGTIACIITSFFATDISPAHFKEDIEPVLKNQLLVSTILATLSSLGISLIALPASFMMHFMNGKEYEVKNWYCFLAVAGGLWAGLAIGYITEYYTSNAYPPVRECANACKLSPATNIIYGLALGYKSCIIPSFALAFSIYLGYNMAGVYGIALGALGILSTMCIALTIDGYGPISDNAGGLAEMAEMGSEVRDRTDALDAAGNTTAAIGKGYAIGSAALVGLALYGAFLSRAYTANNPEIPVVVNIVDPRTFFGLLVGAMLPYWFSAYTMKSVGIAAMAMVYEIQRQFKELPGLMDGTQRPEYEKCVDIATTASLREMIAPGALVVLSPIICGIVFGKEALAGLLPGALVSGVQIAISASNTGGAWDNAKKYIESGELGKEHGKHTLTGASAIVGDMVGDPMKDTYGPALNILIKLMAIISVVFAPVVADEKFGGVVFDQILSGWAAKDA